MHEPRIAEESGRLTIHGLFFAGSDEACDVVIENGRVAAIEDSGDTGKWLCLPPLADLHVHANRAFTPPAARPKGLDDAVQNVAAIFDSFSTSDYQRHASLLYKAALENGTTRLRTHADVGGHARMRAVEGSLLAAIDFTAIDIEVVAFGASSCDPANDAGRSMLRDAIRAGAHYLGAVPAFCADPAATIDAILDLSIELDVPVDLHLDEHLDADSSFSEHLAKATIERGLHGRVTLGHACAVAVMQRETRMRVLDRLAEAQVTVIALPRTNLYLQDIQDGGPRLRGVTCVQEMLDRNIAVRFASDNVRDAFYPFGDADLLGVAMDGILATRVDDPRTIAALICDGRSRIEVGDAASMVLIAGTSFDDVISAPPAERWLFRDGLFKM